VHAFVQQEQRSMSESPKSNHGRGDDDLHIFQLRNNPQVRTLRKTYGDRFLADFRSNDSLRAVLEKTGAASLSELVRGRPAG
jgi:hypothetical protein